MYRSKSAPRLASKYELTPGGEARFKASKRPQASTETIKDIGRENPTDMSVQYARINKVK